MTLQARLGLERFFTRRALERVLIHFLVCQCFVETCLLLINKCFVTKVALDMFCFTFFVDFSLVKPQLVHVCQL